MRIRPLALSTRLLLASALLLPVFLGVSAWMLDTAFQRSLVAAEKERLNGHIYLLLAAAEMQDGELWLPGELTEPRFGRLNSGLYGLVHDAAGSVVWRSPSAALLDVPTLTGAPLQPGEVHFDERVSGGPLFRFSYDVLWEAADGERPYRFTVLHSREPYRAELTAYRRQLWWLLGGLALLLLATQAGIMRWGLRPLKRLAANLRAVERAEADQVHGEYPDEIRPVTDNLNRVLKAERLQRERYRNTLSDLAHSLKTPLAVLRGSLDEPPERLRARAAEQVTRMDDIVSHQLQRAVAGTPPYTARPVAVAPVAERIAGALRKVYAGKPVAFTVTGERGGLFHGAEADLMELLGNLLDNAFKYARREVRLGVGTGDGGALTVTVEDDGPGVPGHLQRRILERGARADTARLGHGIGLAVTADIASSYGGRLDVGRSSSGGARFTVAFPDTCSTPA